MRIVSGPILDSAICLILGLTVFPAPSLRAADRIGTAKQALTLLYPELAGKGLHITINDESLLDTPQSPVSFGLDVLQPVSHMLQVAQPDKYRCPSALLSAGFAFTLGDDDRIFHFSAAGPVVNTGKLQALSDLVDSHPEWTDSQVEQALTKAGAKFGPNAKDQLIRSLPIAALEPLVGHIKVTSAEFILRNQQQMQEHLPSADLTWAVGFTSHIDGRPDRKYFAILEPFEAKLTSILKIPPIP